MVNFRRLLLSSISSSQRLRQKVTTERHWYEREAETLTLVQTRRFLASDGYPYIQNTVKNNFGIVIFGHREFPLRQQGDPLRKQPLGRRRPTCLHTNKSRRLATSSALTRNDVDTFR